MYFVEFGVGDLVVDIFVDVFGEVGVFGELVLSGVDL